VLLLLLLLDQQHPVQECTGTPAAMDLHACHNTMCRVVQLAVG
jgi:hypothetical protein